MVTSHSTMAELYSETLFSFDFLVRYIRLHRHHRISGKLAVGVRLLDFPTLLIYANARANQPAVVERDKLNEYRFNRGKSCLFKMDVESLHAHLSHIPLYVTVLDVTAESPRFIGSSLISLVTSMDSIRRDVSRRISLPEKAFVAICNLEGQAVGAVCLSYKLLCLGASSQPHILKRKAPGSPQLEDEKEKHSSESVQPAHTDSAEGDLCRRTEKQEEHFKAVPHERPTESIFETDMSVFCPPHLYYINTTHERGGNNLPKFDPDDFPFHNSFSEDEDTEESEHPDSGVVHQELSKPPQKSINSERTSEVRADLLKDALQNLPLLNALIAELTQLSCHSPQQSGHLHRPSTPQLLRPPRNCSTPIYAPAKINPDQQETLPHMSCQKKKKKRLVYGTTKTYNLRLKLISPHKVTHHECMELFENISQPEKDKGKTKQPAKMLKFVLKQKPEHHADRGTAIGRDAADSDLGETVTLKPNVQCDAHDSDGQGSLENSDPRVHRDAVFLRKDKKELQSDSDQSDGDKVSTPVFDLTKNQSSSSHQSLHSEPRREDTDYAEDFDSLESSNSSFSKTESNPETSRAKTTKSQSERAPKEPLQFPVKAPSSPHRALMGTHIIRPRNLSSALSFSSDSNETYSVASMRMAPSRKETPSDSEERNSSFESVSSPGVKGSDWPAVDQPAGARSVESVSSGEAAGAEELEEDIGSLDFRKKYQHVSELAANKLPGYTM